MADVGYTQVFKHAEAEEKFFEVQRRKFGSKRATTPRNSITLNRINQEASGLRVDSGKKSTVIDAILARIDDNKQGRSLSPLPAPQESPSRRSSPAPVARPQASSLNGGATSPVPSAADPAAATKDRPSSRLEGAPQRVRSRISTTAGHSDSPMQGGRGDSDSGSVKSGRSSPFQQAKVPTAVRNSLRDQNTLARTMGRAGNMAEAARAHFSRGILLDNQGNYEAAIGCYKKYLAACIRSGDVAGEALAYNHMGVDYQILGGQSLELAIACHRKHAEIADDAGRFISLYNVGLCCAGLGQDDEAVQALEAAVDCAVSTNDLAGQAMAYGQLGAALGRLSDFEQARELLELRVSLAEKVGSSADVALAFKQIGQLCHDSGDLRSAIRHFQRAAEVTENADLMEAAKSYVALAQLCNDEKEFDSARLFYERALHIGVHLQDAAMVAQAKCGVGIAQGNLVMSDYFADLKEHMETPTTIMR